MNPVLTLAAKDLKLLLRDPMGLFWILAFPVIMALFFGAIFGGAGGDPKARSLALVLVDEDGSEAAQSFAARLEKSDALDVTRGTREEAREAVRKGKQTAYVVLKKGFGDSAGFFGGGPTGLEVGLDPSRKAEGGYLQGILMQAWFEGMQERFADPKRMRDMVEAGKKDLDTGSKLESGQRQVMKTFFDGLDVFLKDVDPKVYQNGPQFKAAAIEPVAVETAREGPRSAFEISFPQGILWGLLGCAASFGLSMVTERVKGTYLRLRIAPLSRAQILGGKALACFTACVAVIVALLLLGVFACHVRLQNWAGLALAIPCSAACFVGIMMFTSVLGQTEQSVSGAGWGIFTIMSMIGGGMVPLFVMPPWMRTLSHVSPVKWAIVSLEGAIWRDYSLAEMAVPCAILLGFGAFFLALGLWRFSRLERS